MAELTAKIPGRMQPGYLNTIIKIERVLWVAHRTFDSHRCCTSVASLGARTRGSPGGSGQSAPAMLSQGITGVGMIPDKLHGPASPSNRSKKWSEPQMREASKATIQQAGILWADFIRGALTPVDHPHRLYIWTRTLAPADEVGNEVTVRP